MQIYLSAGVTTLAALMAANRTGPDPVASQPWNDWLCAEADLSPPDSRPGQASAEAANP